VPEAAVSLRDAWPRDVQHRAADWRDLAACPGTDPELFFPVGVTGPGAAQAERAKAVCRGCHARVPCLEFAMDCGVTGVWGATTEAERVDTRRSGRKAGGGR
jgi:WhiB family transcriptional regulator, redox-sensing transcriptional regulator